MTIIFFTLPVSVDEDHGHASQTEDQCSTPSEELTITAIQNEDGSLAYDKQEYKISRGACVEITFKNPYDILHDFSLEEDHEKDFDGFHIAIANKTAINGTDSTSVHIQFPDSDITYDFWCTVISHREAGMESKLIIGKGTTTAPGFEFMIVLLGLFITTIVFYLKRK
ncbi:MAG: plastocyanin/azurin family copper-binding protein [Candidatus Hodarchaeales archaeon]